MAQQLEVIRPMVRLHLLAGADGGLDRGSGSRDGKRWSDSQTLSKFISGGCFLPCLVVGRGECRHIVKSWTLPLMTRPLSRHCVPSSAETFPVF